MSGRLDPWIQILENLEPDYQILKKWSVEPPKVKIKISKQNNRWFLWLEQDWLDPDIDNYDNKNFDDNINWIDRNIINWTTGQREKFNLWSFKSKKQAEKFVTYYSLSCNQ